MASSPALSHEFKVIFDPGPSPVIVQFSQIDGLQSDIEVETYIEGIRPSAPVSFMRRREESTVVLRRGEGGRGADVFLRIWYDRTLVALAGFEPPGGMQTIVKTVYVDKPVGLASGVYTHRTVLYNAWPKAWRGGVLNAESSSVLIAELDLAVGFMDHFIVDVTVPITTEADVGRSVPETIDPEAEIRRAFGPAQEASHPLTWMDFTQRPGR